MRPEDLTDYFKLRKIAANPFDLVRFRNGQRPGRTLEVRMLDGPPLFLRGGCADHHMFHRIFLRNEYRLPAMGHWECVLDLGANVGVFSVRASMLADRVISFEPFSENFAALERNTAGRPGIQPIRAAVAGRAGMLRLYRPANTNRTGAFSSFENSQGIAYAGFEEVPAVTLDEIVRQYHVSRCNLLKLDVEGQEYDILHSASDDTFRRIDRIHGEYHDVAPDDPRTRIDAFTTFLRGKGYAVDVLPHRRKPNHGMFFAARPRLA